MIILRAERAIDWKSCRSISANLARSYRLAYGDRARFVSCGDWRRPSDIGRLARRLARLRPKRLVFLDHTPHPVFVLAPLFEALGDHARPAIDFHVYGDFTRSTRDWLDLEPGLLGAQVRFLCASPNECELISGFLRGKSQSVRGLPFPVDAALFHPDPAPGRAWRQRLGVPAGEPLLVYAGRFSLQKNVLRLLEEFRVLVERRLSQGKTAPRLALAGPFDDIGEPFARKSGPRGAFRKRWRDALLRLPTAVRRRVRYAGVLEPRELRGLYNAADAFVSLSLYHDEDFGMAPAEALLCGTRCVLTGWGGYSGFASEGCRLIPVRFGPEGAEFDSDAVQSALEWALRPTEPRQTLARRERDWLGTKAVAVRLRKLESGPAFSGFSGKLREHAEILSSRGGLSVRDPFYRRVYGPFIKRGKSLRLKA